MTAEAIPGLLGGLLPGLLLAGAVLLAWPAHPRPDLSDTAHRWWVLPVLAVLAATLRPGHTAVLVLIVAAACWAGRELWRRLTSARRAARTGELVVEVCDVVAAELAAGRPPETVLHEAASVWPELRPVADACRLGGDVPSALRVVALTPGAGGLRLLAGAWAVSHRTGAGLADSSRRVSDAVRRDLATRRVVAGELASARATSRLVAMLPVLALLMGSGAGADPWTFLLGTPFGLACLAAGLAVGFAGLWWIELIAREVVT